MSRFDSQPSRSEIILRKFAPIVLVLGAVGVGSACSAEDNKPSRGEIVCTDVQQFTAEKDQTYSDLIAENTERDTSPADFQLLQNGIESAYLEHKGDLPDTFVIPNVSKVDTPHVSTNLGQKYEVPTNCEKAE